MQRVAMTQHERILKTYPLVPWFQASAACSFHLSAGYHKVVDAFNRIIYLDIKILINKEIYVMLPFQGALRENCRPASSSKVLLVIAVVAIALNLRPSLATIGPVLDRIEAATGMTSVGAGLLTTLPVS